MVLPGVRLLRNINYASSLDLKDFPQLFLDLWQLWGFELRALNSPLTGVLNVNLLLHIAKDATTNIQEKFCDRVHLACKFNEKSDSSATESKTLWIHWYFTNEIRTCVLIIDQR